MIEALILVVVVVAALAVFTLVVGALGSWAFNRAVARRHESLEKMTEVDFCCVLILLALGTATILISGGVVKAMAFNSAYVLP